MAIRTVYYNSTGPFYYDDADVYPGTAIGMKGTHTDGPIQGDRVRSNTAPIIPIDVLRLADLAGLGILEFTVTDRSAYLMNTEYTNGTAYDMIVLVSAELQVV